MTDESAPENERPNPLGGMTAFFACAVVASLILAVVIVVVGYVALAS